MKVEERLEGLSILLLIDNGASHNYIAKELVISLKKFVVTLRDGSRKDFFVVTPGDGSRKDSWGIWGSISYKSMSMF